MNGIEKFMFTTKRHTLQSPKLNRAGPEYALEMSEELERRNIWV